MASDTTSPVDNGLAIDSLKLRIPVSCIGSISPYLYDNRLTISEMTGELLSTDRKSIEKHESINFQLKNIVHSYKTPVECLVMTIPSKILKSNYFQGITSGNFQTVFDAITDSGLIKIDKDSFLTNAIATDIDIKKDLDFNSKHFKAYDSFPEYCAALKSNAKPTTKIGRGVKMYNNEKSGQGIQFGIRSQSTIGYPFLKIYNKTLELKTKSKDFADTYLNDIDYSNKIRVEMTIKNSNHIRRILGDSKNTLYNVLSYSQDDLRKFFKHAYKVHTSGVTAKRKPRSKLTGNKLVMYNYIKALDENGLSRFDIENLTIQDSPNRMHTSRMRELFSELYSMAISERKDSQNGLESIFD